MVEWRPALFFSLWREIETRLEEVEVVKHVLDFRFKISCFLVASQH